MIKCMVTRTNCKLKKAGKTKGTVRVVNGAFYHFCVLNLCGTKLYTDTCIHRKSANRQARRIAERLGMEVVK